MMTRTPDEITIYATCWMSIFYPHLGEHIREALTYIGRRARLSSHVACCGWLSYTAGDWVRAQEEADAWVHAHLPESAVVVPSPACATFLRHHTRYLFEQDPAALDRVQDIQERIWEFGAYVNAIDAPVRMVVDGKILYVAGCGEGPAAGETWLRRHLGDNVMSVPTTCCADGGIFAVAMPELSAAMVSRLAHHIRTSGASYVVTDEPACHFHLHRALASTSIQVVHLADLMQRGM